MWSNERVYKQVCVNADMVRDVYNDTLYVLESGTEMR